MKSTLTSAITENNIIISWQIHRATLRTEYLQKNKDALVIQLSHHSTVNTPKIIAANKHILHLHCRSPLHCQIKMLEASLQQVMYQGVETNLLFSICNEKYESSLVVAPSPALSFLSCKSVETIKPNSDFEKYVFKILT